MNLSLADAALPTSAVHLIDAATRWLLDALAWAGALVVLWAAPTLAEALPHQGGVRRVWQMVVAAACSFVVIVIATFWEWPWPAALALVALPAAFASVVVRLRAAQRRLVAFLGVSAWVCVAVAVAASSAGPAAKLAGLAAVLPFLTADCAVRRP